MIWTKSRKAPGFPLLITSVRIFWSFTFGAGNAELEASTILALPIIFAANSSAARMVGSRLDPAMSAKCCCKVSYAFRSSCCIFQGRKKKKLTTNSSALRPITICGWGHDGNTAVIPNYSVPSHQKQSSM